MVAGVMGARQRRFQFFGPALTAAEAGLADLREIIAGALPFLKQDGWLALETGIAQHAELITVLAAAGWVGVESKRDLTDRDRFMFARRPAL